MYKYISCKIGWMDGNKWAPPREVEPRPLGRLDRLFDAPMPYMMWIHQRPTDGGDWPAARVHLHITPLLRSAQTQRFVAAAELGWPSLPVEISYFDGGERVESGAMYPGKIGLA